MDTLQENICTLRKYIFDMRKLNYFLSELIISYFKPIITESLATIR